MDVLTPLESASTDSDPKHSLSSEVAKARAERDDLDRQIAADNEILATIRTALDGMMSATWRDIFGQQQRMCDRENIASALTLGWTGGYQLIAAAGLLVLFSGAMFAFHAVGVILAIVSYLAISLVGYVVARDQCLAPIKKARSSYLGDDGKDVRFVAFSRYEPGLHHPLLGSDGPTNGKLEDRAWKIPGVRDKEAMQETFIELIDERRGNVLLTRFPDRKPTLVHADLENPFIRAYGVFFQRALERRLPSVQSHANDFRQIVAHASARKEIDERVRLIESELHEFDGTAAIMNALPFSIGIRNRMLHHVVQFRLGDPSVRRGMFIAGGERIDMTDVLQTLARASAATLLQLSFSQIKIGYVGQGASTVGRIFDAAKRARSIIFIDEAEKFFSTVGSSAYESMRREVVHALLNEWDALGDRADIWIVAAAHRRDGLDDGIVARFGTLIDLSPGAASHDDTTTVIGNNGAAAEVPFENVALPEPVVQRNRLLSAMFAHVQTMESQGITVPRAVLIAGPSRDARQSVVNSLAEQSGLPLIDAKIDELDAAIVRAHAGAPALVSLEVPEYGDPGAIAHLAVTIEDLTESKTPIFILATTTSADGVDPELRSRFTEFVDLAELDVEARRETLRELLAGRPLEFDLDAAMEHLESQTDGMTHDQLHHFVDEGGRRAALRAIDAGTPENVQFALADFERRGPLATVATKDDEAAL